LKILVVTASYHPFISPRAHRWTALAEHWAAQGHEIHVVCSRVRGCAEESVLNGVRVHRAGFDSLKEVFYYYFSNKNARGRLGEEAKSASWPSRLMFFLYKNVWKKVHFPDDASIWYFPALRKSEYIIKEHQIQAVVSVSFPFTGHLVGLALKRKFPHLRWLADTGDPFSIRDVPLYNEFLYGKTIRRLEREILQTADCVTVTTPALNTKYKEVFGETTGGNVAVVPPLLHPLEGFSATEIPPDWKVEKRPDEIHLGYFGAFLPIIRRPDALLKCLDWLQIFKPETFEKLRIHIFGEILPDFLPDLQKKSAVMLYGLRSREHTRAAMSQMDGLIHIGNRTDYQLPSKSVDYLASGLPVLHFSYLENDPFMAFWGNMPGLSVIRVEGEILRGIEKIKWEMFGPNAKRREEMMQTRTASARAFGVETAEETFLKLLR
jgi:hypothetical protein